MENTLNLYHTVKDQSIDCGVIPNINLGKFGDNGRFKVLHFYSSLYFII